MKIAILGAGAYGKVLGGILERNQFKVDFYDPYQGFKDLGAALEGAGAVFLAAPSNAAAELVPLLPSNIPLVLATKGFLNLDLFKEFSDVMAVSGPSYAADLAARRQARLTVTNGRLTEWLNQDFIKFDQTSDLLGVVMCGALKNVYAILAGYQGLNRATPAWGKYIRQVLLEMAEILRANGARPETVRLACGRGDLELSCGRPGRNYDFGCRLVQNIDYQPEQTVEGVSALARIAAGEMKMPAEAPILNQILNLKEWK